MQIFRTLKHWKARFSHLVLDFPLRDTLLMLWQRFREDHLALTASSLTLTTLMAMVPFFVLILAIFTAFPMFGRLRQALESWMVESLIPPAIAQPVLEGLMNFASHAGKLGTVSMLLFVLTVFSLMSGINQHLNAIWRVRKLRPLGQRILIFWAAATIGPVLFGGSIVTTSYLLSLSRGWVTGFPVVTPDGLQLLIDLIEFSLMALSFAALYHLVPNTQVRWSHAFAGGVFAAAGITAGQQLIGWYLKSVPSISVVYGTFAAVPILLIWLYLIWIVILLGAVIAAYLPSLLDGLRRHGKGMGWQMQLAIELLRRLHQAQQTPRRGACLEELARGLRVEAPQLESILEEMAALDWVARLDEGGARWVLIAPIASTRMQPLIERWLLPRSPQLDALWRYPPEEVTLADVLHPPRLMP